MEHRVPPVSIGLPVRNGSNFLQATIRSIQQQTFEDYEVIISDNASTDNTAEICEAYAAADKRVKYHRLNENIGAAKNFNRVFELSRGRYFKWIAHDDLIGPEFLSRCVVFLEQRRDVILVESRSVSIDAQGGFQSAIIDEMNARSDQAHERLSEVINGWHACTMVFGLMRREVLSLTPLIAAQVGSDRNLLAELAIHGKLEFLSDYLCSFREHPERSMRKHYDEQQRLTWFDPKLAGRPIFPTLRRAIGYRSSIARAPIDENERAKCFHVLERWCRVGMHYSKASIAGLLTQESAAAIRNPQSDPEESEFARRWLTGDKSFLRTELPGSSS